ncbi:fasciclin domain-containing protein [Paraferrimonas sedimenticola]|uniref:FAS1 domain-containing protein n=1 Tax=Paraferrimonas sedimenticola TaxID=375674 RepID=A0AA37VVV7_9GAMM|nr:fasciclin domain-containing protein [Paraferrimonas sedimenticola]GLP96221.1 hypothetical protein GCM10007895_15270 [Paraferrimonas sedimenticola]
MNLFTRSINFSLALVGVLLIASVANPALAKKPKWAQKNDVSIVEFAVAASANKDEDTQFDDADDPKRGDDFDVLVAALIATGAVGLFDGTDYTVFAPNDNAFYMLTGTDNDEDAFNAAVSTFGAAGVLAVLQYHVTEGVRNSRSVKRAQQITMADGNTISFRNGLIIATNSEAEILDADNRFTDGMIHVIDTVLLP